MPNLFSTFGRAALVALGLAVAPAAFADADFSQSCPAGSTPILGAGGGQSVTFGGCAVDCGAGSVATVTGGNVTCSAGVPTQSAPSGCTLSASPTSGASGAGTTLTAKCTGGNPTALTLTWTIPNGTASCNTSGTVGQNTTCAVSNITAGTTFQVKFGNGVGTDVTKTASYSVTAGGGGGFASCPSGTRTSTGIYPRQYAPPGSSTDEVGSLPAGAIMSFKFTPTATSGSGGFFGSAIYGGNRYATWNVSTTACDFANSVSYVDSRGRTKFMGGSTSSNIDTGWTYGSQLQAGQTYYFNIKMNSCDSDNCHYDSLRFW